MLKESPFQPGYPVDPEKFKGRKKITEQVDRYLPKILKSEAQHFFITGKRGMGKTSLATYINSFVKRKYKLIGIHVLNDGVHDVNSLIKQIIERLLNEIETETWSETIIKKFKKYIVFCKIIFFYLYINLFKIQLNICNQKLFLFL